jgi:two-component system sensor histidine kinase NreB
MYRIAQEALHNAYKHANAKKIDVFLHKRDDVVVLSVIDDGIGFDPQQPHNGENRGLGLVGMRERAALIGGTLFVESASTGTSIIVSAPAAFLS